MQTENQDSAFYAGQPTHSWAQRQNALGDGSGGGYEG
jgi:hypothetical protein